MSVTQILENGLRQMRKANEELLLENQKLLLKVNALVTIREPSCFLQGEPEEHEG